MSSCNVTVIVGPRVTKTEKYDKFGKILHKNLD